MFLELIPDEPKMANYVTASGSISILDQLTHLRAQGVYHNGGVPDSAMELAQLLRNHYKYSSIQVIIGTSRLTLSDVCHCFCSLCLR